MSAAETEPPLLALGVCTFNRGARIVETLDAILRMELAQGRLARLIIIDNNSSDETPRVIDDYIRDHPHTPISRIREPVQGIGAARARFMREASEPYLAMLDDDVIPHQGWAGAMVRALDNQPRAGWIGGRIELCLEPETCKSGGVKERAPARQTHQLKLIRRCRTMLAHQDFGPAPLVLDRPDQGMASAAFAARREAIIASGWLDHRLLGGREGGGLESGEDYEICIRMRRNGWKVCYTPDAVVEHLIPARRQTVEYLARLARGVSLSKAQLKWLGAGQPGIEWAKPYLVRARRKLARARLLEWRPGVRTLKLAEHEGRVQSWERLVSALGVSPSTAPSNA